MQTRQLLSKSLKKLGSVLKFFVYLSLIVTENFREKITDKGMEKLKTPSGNFCKRLVPKMWSV